MAGVYATDQLEKIAVDAAGLLNAAFSGGFGAVFVVLSTLSDLRDVDWALAGKEVKELDAEDRAKVEAKFKAKLDLTNKAVEAKIEAGLSLVDDGFNLAAEGVELYRDSVAYVGKAQALLGV